MGARTDRFAKLALFCGLALVFYKGITGIPEVATRFFPESFFSPLIRSAEGTLVMKERFSDFYRETDRALALRLAELAAGEATAHALVNKERVEMAGVKNTVKIARTEADLGLVREKLERMRRLADEHWTMGWFVCGARPDPLRQRPCAGDGGLAAKRVDKPDELTKAEGPTP